MWTLDDFIRDEIAECYNLLLEDKEEEFIGKQAELVADVRDLMDKEENILYPTSLEMINEEEFRYMAEGDQEIGFAYITVDKEKSGNQNTLSLLQTHLLLQDFPLPRALRKSWPVY